MSGLRTAITSYPLSPQTPCSSHASSPLSGGARILRLDGVPDKET